MHYILFVKQTVYRGTLNFIFGAKGNKDRLVGGRVKIKHYLNLRL